MIGPNLRELRIKCECTMQSELVFKCKKNVFEISGLMVFTYIDCWDV